MVVHEKSAISLINNHVFKDKFYHLSGSFKIFLFDFDVLQFHSIMCSEGMLLFFLFGCKASSVKENQILKILSIVLQILSLPYFIYL